MLINPVFTQYVNSNLSLVLLKILIIIFYTDKSDVVAQITKLTSKVGLRSMLLNTDEYMDGKNIYNKFRH